MDMTVMQKIVDSLSVKELLAVKEKIEERLVRNIDFKEFMEQIIEQRFAEGLVCPRCGGKHIKKFGFYSRGTGGHRVRITTHIQKFTGHSTPYLK